MKSLAEFIEACDAYGNIAFYNLTVRGAVNESSLNRLTRWLTSCECAFITAYRNKIKDVKDKTKTYFGKNNETPEGTELSHEQNRDRDKLLAAFLQSSGYGIIKVKGVYPEGMSDEASEESYLAFNINCDKDFYKNVFAQSEYFNQDSFFYKPADSEYGYLIGTNCADYPGYGNNGVRSKFVAGISSNFMSRIKNSSFAFLSDDAVKNSSKEEAMSEIEKETSQGVYRQHYWRDSKKTSFKDRKNKRISESLMERIMQTEQPEIRTVNDLHPLTRKCMTDYIIECIGSPKFKY